MSVRSQVSAKVRREPGAPGKLYWFGTGSAPVAESDASGNLTNEYIFFDGHRVAMKRMSDATVHYYFADQIGSANMVTNATGAMPPEQDIEYHPYGEQQIYTDTLGQEYKFTGKEHDPETNNDYFGARYYSSTMGRFLTPDWSATPVPIPYAVMGNPQTLNLYSYVENNPITSTDPDGHYSCNGVVSNSPCPKDNQAPDIREDAKKTADEKAIANLKAYVEKASQEAIGFFKGALNEVAIKPLNMMATWFESDKGPIPQLSPANPDQAQGAQLATVGLTLASAVANPEAEEGTIGQNAAKGKAFEKSVVATTKATDINVAEQLTLKTESGVKTRMDVVSTKTSGEIRLQEAKSSPTAPLTKNQQLAHPEIGKTGATVVGRGKTGYPGGTKIPPTKVDVVRPQ
jgi:RHS repeat-associated protein